MILIPFPPTGTPLVDAKKIFEIHLGFSPYGPLLYQYVLKTMIREETKKLMTEMYIRSFVPKQTFDHLVMHYCAVEDGLNAEAKLTGHGLLQSLQPRPCIFHVTLTPFGKFEKSESDEKGVVTLYPGGSQQIYLENLNQCDPCHVYGTPILSTALLHGEFLQQLRGRGVLYVQVIHPTNENWAYFSHAHHDPPQLQFLAKSAKPIKSDAIYRGECKIINGVPAYIWSRVYQLDEENGPFKDIPNLSSQTSSTFSSRCGYDYSANCTT